MNPGYGENMIFTGDVAIAEVDDIVFENFPPSIKSQPWCVNLEGPLVGGEPSCSRVVYNNEVAFRRAFKEFNVKAYFLGNNHIKDLSDGLESTISNLSSRGNTYFGAGLNALDAASPAVIEGEGGVVLLGFGWDVIGCVSAGKDSSGVNLFSPHRVLKDVRSIKRKYNDNKIVVVIHGNYEFEKYPQPAHRKLSLQLIDEGVHAVIFHHSHVIGPIEIYKDKVIAYGLGNWAFSYGRYFDGKLRFPEVSFQQLAIDVSGEAGIVGYLSEFDPASGVVSYKEKIQFKEAGFKYRAEFSGFNDLDYEGWFEKNRIKKRLLPIYRVGDGELKIRLKSFWVRVRKSIIDVLVVVKIKSLKRNFG